MSESKSTSMLSPATLTILSTPLSILCFLFFYLSLASFIFASAETILGIVRKDDKSASWWRRSRLVALTYAQMYLSQHFLRVLTSGKPGADVPEKSFLMASQTIAAGIVMFSVTKHQNTTERLLIGQCYKLERPQIAQLILTSAVAFNIHLIAGPLTAVLTAIALLISLDWRVLILFFEGIATWKASKGSVPAELTWCILHVALAVGLVRAVQNFDREEGHIALPLDDEENALDFSVDEKTEAEVDSMIPDDILRPSASLPAGRLFLMLCVILVFAGAIAMTVFFGLETLLFPKLQANKDQMNAEALILSRLFTTEAIGIILIVILTVRELSGNAIVRCIADGLS